MSSSLVVADDVRRQRETQRVYSSLRLGSVPNEWVREIWDGNFCESLDGIDTNDDGTFVELSQSLSTWKDVIDVTQTWTKGTSNESYIADEGQHVTSFWTVLYDVGINHKTLLSVLFVILERKKSSCIETLCSISCAQLYLVLLQLPGTSAYKVFHTMLFQKSLDVVHLQPATVSIGKYKRSNTSTSSEGQLLKGRKRKRRATEELEDDVFGDTTDDSREIPAAIKCFLHELLSVLRSFSLRDHEVTRQQVISSVLKMCHIDISTSVKELDMSSIVNISSHSSCPTHHLTWACLDALCSTHHGLLENILVEVFQQLVPVITMVTGSGGGKTGSTSSSIAPATVAIPSQHAVTFIEYIVKERGKVTIHPLKTLIQHICISTPDKADYRNKLAGVVCVLMRLFDDAMYAELIKWIYKFSRNTKVSYRVFSIDIINQLLSQSTRAVSVHEEHNQFLSYQFLLKMMLARCSDKSPSVRARALTCLATVAGYHDNEELVAVIHQVIFSADVGTGELMEADSNEDGSESVVMAMLRRRTSDNKVAVRKAAILALEVLSNIREDSIDIEDVMAIHERCMDPALSVRKQAMVSLTELVMKHKDIQYRELHSVWLDGIFPMVLDREIGAKEKCLSNLENVFLRGLFEVEVNEFVWKLLTLLTNNDRPDLRRCLHFAVQNWCQNGKITNQIVTEISKHTNIEHHKEAAWIFLSELSAFNTSITSKFLLDAWRRYGNVSMATGNESILVSLLTMIGHSVKRLGKIQSEDIKNDCIQLLSLYQLPLSLISVTVNTVTMICTGFCHSQEDYQGTIDKWILPVLKSCEEYIQNTLSSQQQSITSSDTESSTQWNINEQQLMTYLFTLGELAQLCPTRVSAHTKYLVQSLLLATREGPTSNVSNQPPSFSSSKLSHFESLQASPNLRAISYITLGKLCLQDEDLTKNSLLLMSYDLEHSIHPPVKNNIIITLCDLAVRYSSKVDPYIPRITNCLKDESFLIRKQTLTLLAHLLQEDYIKWKGSLFFHFVSTLIDKDLKTLTEYCLVHLLHSRNPNIFYNNFVECIFHFNEYSKHKVYNQFCQSETEKKLFSMSGPSCTYQRMEIYKFLLSHMSDEQRFQLTAKLCHEVLGSIIDQVIPFDNDSTYVIKDTLAVLTSKEIKHSTLRQQAQGEIPDENDSSLEIAMTTAQTKIISQIVKKNVIENIIPIIIATKHLFEQERSPLLKDLLICLKELMQDYRNEIKNVLSGDPQLADEIEFDLRKFEEQQKLQSSCAHHTSNIRASIDPMGSPFLSSTRSLLATPRASSVLVTVNSPRLKKTAARNETNTAVRNENSSSGPAQSTLLITQKAPAPVSMAKTPLCSQGSHQTQQLMETATPTNNSLLRTPKTNLAKLAILTSARKAAATTARALDTIHEDNTTEINRATSTPQGITEAISFNVSSTIPPSPIPANTMLRSYIATTRDNDIVMRLPEDGPQTLPQWNIN